MSAPGPVRAADVTRADWETPAELFDQLNREFRFTLDAAASESNAKVWPYLTGPHVEYPCACGLCSSWSASPVWVNPPYGKGLEDWAHKFGTACRQGATVVALLPNATDTKWFQLVWNMATEIRLLRGRVQFVGTTSSNPSGSIVAIYRPDGMPTGTPHVRLWDWRK